MTFEYWWAAYINRGPIRNAEVVKRVAEAAWDFAIAQTKAEIPKCPQCGEHATYQTADGTYWDSQAHYWRVGA